MHFEDIGDSAGARRLLFNLWASLTLMAAFLCAGCEHINSGAPVVTVAAGTPPGSPDYSGSKLSEGDVVSITFQYSSNYNTIQKISLDGFLNLESAGPVKAAGKAPLELQDEVAALYKGLTKNDTATVKLVTAVSSVSVAGAVFRPGRIALDRPMTVLEALVESGGYDPNRANLNKVTVLRIIDGKQQTYRLNLNRLLQGKEEGLFYLKPFDIIHVPMKTFNY